MGNSDGKVVHFEAFRLRRRYGEPTLERLFPGWGLRGALGPSISGDMIIIDGPVHGPERSDK